MAATTPTRIAAVRAFNRFYTRRLGMLGPGLLGTEHPLPQARVIYELGQRPTTAAADLQQSRSTSIAGYLSRLLAGLEPNGLVDAAPLTSRRPPPGGLASRPPAAPRSTTLDDALQAEIRELLERLADDDQRRVLAAMHALEDAWDETPRPRAFTLRAPRAGELGWVVQRHGALYAAEHGFDQSFEALVAEIVARLRRARRRPRTSGLDRRRRRRARRLRRSACARTTRPPSCGCCSSSRTRAAWASAPGSWSSACSSPQQAGYDVDDAVDAEHPRGRPAGCTSAPASDRSSSEEPHRSFGRDLVDQTWTRELSPPSRT